MNFNIYLDDETGAKLNEAAAKSGDTRNAVIRRAVSEWLNRRGQSEWPTEVRQFTGVADMTPFEARRDTLKPPAADPLA